MQLFISVDSIEQAQEIIAFLDGRSQSDHATGRTGSSGGRSSTKPADDGWGDESDPDAEDPWGDSTPTKSSGSRQGGAGGLSGGNQGPWADVPRDGDRWVETKTGKRHYEFGLDDAPDCNCGYPAVKFSGKGKNGLWSKWQCALTSTKSYRDKCDFEEWASRK